jgi:hypothetical protein
MEHKNPIYHLAECKGSLFFGHLIIYIVGGLYHIPQDAQYPIKVFIDKQDGPMTKANMFEQIFDIISDKYILLKELPKDEEYTIIPMRGETCEKDGVSDNPHLIFPFLRELFLSRINLEYRNTPKRFFIGRKSSFKTGNTGNTFVQRCILNEERFSEKLKEFNIETIYLEDYTFENKIRLFNEADLVLSTYSSALACAIWCKKTGTVIEMMPNRPNTVIGTHNKILCNSINIKYFKFYSVDADEHDNFIIEDDNDIYEFLSL